MTLGPSFRHADTVEKHGNHNQKDHGRKGSAVPFKELAQKMVKEINAATHPDQITQIIHRNQTNLTNISGSAGAQIDRAVKRWHRKNPGSYSYQSGKQVWTRIT